MQPNNILSYYGIAFAQIRTASVICNDEPNATERDTTNAFYVFAEDGQCRLNCRITICVQRYVSLSLESFHIALLRRASHTVTATELCRVKYICGDRRKKRTKRFQMIFELVRLFSDCFFFNRFIHTHCMHTIQYDRILFDSNVTCLSVLLYWFAVLDSGFRLLKSRLYHISTNGRS